MTTQEFTALVRQYQGLVYTVCHQLVPDEGVAQDLAQETFLAAWRAIDRCPPGCEKQWLARIAANKAKDHLRSAWARRMAGAPADQGPEAQALAQLGAEELEQKILALQEPYRTPCRLCLLEGYTPAEAARISRRPEKTLNAQLWRAKKMLRAQIEQEQNQERRIGDGTV